MDRELSARQIKTKLEEKSQQQRLSSQYHVWSYPGFWEIHLSGPNSNLCLKLRVFRGAFYKLLKYSINRFGISAFYYILHH